MVCFENYHTRITSEGMAYINFEVALREHTYHYLLSFWTKEHQPELFWKTEVQKYNLMTQVIIWARQTWAVLQTLPFLPTLLNGNGELFMR